MRRFSVCGGRRLETDLRRGLLPVLGAFTSRPQAHLPLAMVRTCTCTLHLHPAPCNCTYTCTCTCTCRTA